MRRTPASPRARLGLRANAAQFALLVAVNALVGGMLGQERTVLPLLAEREFGITGYAAATTFIVAFGLTKAATNFAAGALADRYGRKPVLIAGWLLGVPVPVLLITAPSWGWVVAANVLLGVNQGLTWSTTVIMKIDLVGPARRGLAMGLNEAAGYAAVAATALATGYLASAHGLRPAPFLLGLAFAALGLGLSTIFVAETRGHAHLDAATHTPAVLNAPAPSPAATPSTASTTTASGTAGRPRLPADLTTAQVFRATTLDEPALSSASQAGLVNNLNDGLAWGLFPLLFASAGLTVTQIGVLAALYPGVWGLGQLVTGAASDRLGRKRLIVGGMWLQAAALALVSVADSFSLWAVAAVTLGAGTAMVYPTLLAAIGDVAHPAWRARSVGVYRLWRDAGFVVGALVGGLAADAYGLRAAVLIVAVLTAASGALVAARMYETHASAARLPDPAPRKAA